MRLSGKYRLSLQARKIGDELGEFLWGQALGQGFGHEAVGVGLLFAVGGFVDFLDMAADEFEVEFVDRKPAKW